MISIRELEEHFGKDFEKIVNDNDIVYIGDSIEIAMRDYVEYEKERYNNNVSVEILLTMCYWLENATKDNLFDNELDTYERYFKVVENGKIYYLNSVDFC